VIGLYRQYDLVVWWSTPVEIGSALARLARMNQLDRRAWMEARKLAKKLADSWMVVEPSAALRRHAEQLVDEVDLRAADSLQLAAALAWCENVPEGHIFLTLDHRLRAAALRYGFDARQV
jgi:predicted nucleic acid-binding protein